ncbi:MAG: hypothetical protein QOE97_1077 [Pseudonocardiales bacterium]|nr:hypothetical protein [Pseudonocardiales bacterium]
MHVVDLIAACAAVVVLVLFIAVLARQHYMLRVAGGQPVAFRVRNERWVYGIARYAGGEFRWYRALGIGTRPSKVLARNQLTVVGHRPPTPAEHNALPSSAVVVECRYGDAVAIMAFGEGGFTGFVSWLEASAPRS